nr:gluconokinase, GntK/IdnK-type [Bacteroidota bacterium]
DYFHSLANREKMKSGLPLTDEDRGPWLQILNDEIMHLVYNNGGILACSALKESYRQILTSEHSLPVRWVYLKGKYDVICARLNSREGHYMNPVLLQSQFDALEEPVYGITIDIDQSVKEIEAAVLKAVEV